jgi:hypothetical protein
MLWSKVWGLDSCHWLFIASHPKRLLCWIDQCNNALLPDACDEDIVCGCVKSCVQCVMVSHRSRPVCGFVGVWLCGRRSQPTSRSARWRKQRARRGRLCKWFTLEIAQVRTLLQLLFHATSFESTDSNQYILNGLNSRQCAAIFQTPPCKLSTAQYVILSSHLLLRVIGWKLLSGKLRICIKITFEVITFCAGHQ